MRRLHLAAAATSLFLAGLGLTAAARSAHADGDPVVLVELFTSEGCSSCPPADRLLSILGRPDALDGVRVIPLAFHVDYWDDLGWRDPFGSPAWTERQRRYAAVLSDDRSYTPQLVIGGAAHVVGSDARGATSAIRRAAARPAPVRLDLRAVLDRRARRVVVTASAERVSGRAPLDLWVALVESDLDMLVTRGENQGRRLPHDHVVRTLARAARLDGGARRAHGTLTLPVDRSWRPRRLQVVLFAQDPADLGVVAARRETPVPGRP